MSDQCRTCWRFTGKICSLHYVPDDPCPRKWPSAQQDKRIGPDTAIAVPFTADAIDQLAGLVGVGLRLIRTHEGWAVMMPGHDIVSARTLAEVVELALDVAHAPARTYEEAPSE